MWPPEGANAEALGELARLIATRGAARWLDTPPARCDYHDLPEPWWADRAVGERLLARLCWLAFVDLDVELEGPPVEQSAGQGLPYLRWLETVDGVARFALVHHGDRGAAGTFAVEVGRAFLAWTGDDAPDVPAGVVAAVYLGLGVLVAHAGAPVATDEGLYLLAAQAVARGGDRSAFSTLPAGVQARLAETIDALAPHRDALLHRLAIDPAAPRRPLERDPAPALPGDDAPLAWYGLDRVCWDDVGPASSGERAGELFAIWSEPLEEDPVLVRAGLDAGPERRRDQTDQSAPVADLYELIEAELRTPPGVAPWDAPVPALSLGDGVIWLWLAAPHRPAWSRVLAALPRPLGEPLPSRTPLRWHPDDVHDARSNLEPLESRYAWVAELAQVKHGAIVTLHAIGPASADLQRRVDSAWCKHDAAMSMRTRDDDGVQETWTVYGPRTC